MQLYFVRHGESFNNQLEGHADYYERRKTDPELTARGREQGTRAGMLLAGEPEKHEHARRHRLHRNPWNHEGFELTHVYSSLQRRAVETTQLIAEHVDVDPVAWPDIHECGGVVRYDAHEQRFRGARGASFDEVRAWLPHLRLEPMVGPAVDRSGWWAERDLETRDESADRADRVYRALLEMHGGTDDRVLLVSHSMFYVFFMCRVLNLPFVSELWFTLNNGAITRIDIGDGDDYEPGIDAGWRRVPGLPVRIAYTNRLDHLPVELVS